MLRPLSSKAADLCADVARARLRRYTQSGQKTAVVDPYVEVRAGAEVFRTPFVHSSPAPAWNWDFDLRLPAPLGTAGALNSLRCVECCWGYSWRPL